MREKHPNLDSQRNATYYENVVKKVFQSLWKYEKHLFLLI